MDIKYRPDGSVDIKPTKTELKQAEATLGMMRGVVANTGSITHPVMHDSAERCVENIEIVLAGLNGEPTTADE